MSKPFPKIEPGDRMEMVPMSSADKERISNIAGELVDWLHAKTKNPVEAVMLLDLVREALANRYQIKHVSLVNGEGGAQA